MEQEIKRYEDNMLLSDKKVFGDNDEHDYDLFCYDGYAVAIPTVGELVTNPNAPKVLMLTYPKLEVFSDEQKREILDYRGIYDEAAHMCNYADVCMRYGKITQMMVKTAPNDLKVLIKQYIEKVKNDAFRTDEVTDAEGVNEIKLIRYNQGMKRVEMFTDIDNTLMWYSIEDKILPKKERIAALKYAVLNC